MMSLIDPEDGPEGGTVVLALNAIIPPPNPATAGPAVCVAVWLTYKNVMGSFMAMGGRDLFPTCWVIPVSCVNNAHSKAIWATHNLKRRKGPKFLLITYTCSSSISLVTSLNAGESWFFFSPFGFLIHFWKGVIQTSDWKVELLLRCLLLPPLWIYLAFITWWRMWVRGWDGMRETGKRVCVSERERETYTP